MPSPRATGHCARRSAHTTRLALLAATLAIPLTPSRARAISYAWDGGGIDSNWSTPANWNPDGAPASGPDASLTFAGTTNLSPNQNLANPFQLNVLTFSPNSGSFNLTGSPLNFTNSSSASLPSITQSAANNQTVSNNLTLTNNLSVFTIAAGSLSLNGIISGAGSLTKNGTSTLTLGGASPNTFTGPVTVSQGTLLLAKPAGTAANNFGSAIAGALTINSAATVRLAADSQLSDSSLTTINGGTLDLQTFAEGTTTGISMTAGSITGTGAGVLNLLANFTTNASPSSATVSSKIDLFAATRTFTVADGAALDDLVISGPISNGSLTKSGAGVMTLSGANTYAGATTVSAGTLRIQTAASPPGTVTNNATLDFSPPAFTGLTAANTISGIGTVSISGFGSTITLSSASNAYTGSTLINSNATLVASATTNLGASTAPLVFNGGAFKPSASTTFSHPTTLNNLVGADTYPANTLDTAGNSVTFNSPISGAGGLTKTGAGNLTLTGAPSFAGPLRVAGGTLTLSRSSSQFPSTSVANGATLRVGAANPFASSTADVTLDPGSTFDLAGQTATIRTLYANSGGPYTMTAGTLVASSLNLWTYTNSTSTISSNLKVNANGAGATIQTEFHFGDTVDYHLDLAGSISGNIGTLTFTTPMYDPDTVLNAPGTTRLSGTAANSFTGATSVFGNYLLLAKSPGVNAIPGDLTVSGGVVYNLSGDNSNIYDSEVRLMANDQIADSATVTLQDPFSAFAANGFSDTIKNLVVNSGALVRGPGTITVTNATTLAGGSIGATLVNNGTLNWAAGNFNGRLINNGSFNAPNPNPTFGNGLQSNTPLSLPTGYSLTLNGQGLDNQALLSLTGGTLTGNGPLVNNSTLTGFGTISSSGSFTNNLQVTVSGGAFTFATATFSFNAGTIDLAAGPNTLKLNGTQLGNYGTINLNGNSIAGTGILNNNGVVAGHGAITSPLINNGLILATGGSLNLPDGSYGGIFRVATGSSFSGGTITLLSSATLQGDGTVTNNLTSGGTIEPTGTLNFINPLTTTLSSLIRIPTGSKLLLNSGLATNTGLISLTGGTFDNAARTLTNNGSITGYGTLATGSLLNNASVTLAGGTTTINGPVTNSPSKNFKIQAATAVFTHAVTNNGTFQVLAGGAAVFANGFSGSAPSAPSLGPSSPSLAGSLTVDPTGSVQSDFVRQDTVSSSGTIILHPSSQGGDTSSINSLSLTPTAAMDLADNRLILSSATPTPNLRSYLLTANLWSSTASADPQHRLAIAYATASDLATTTWGGLTVDPTSTLLKTTYLGDANLDGTINADDYALLDRGFRTSGSTWTQGDFNYDGQVTSADYLLIDRVSTQLTGTYSPSATLLAQRESQFGDAYVAQLLTSIPEPALLFPASVFFITTARRRLRLASKR